MGYTIDWVLRSFKQKLVVTAYLADCPIQEVPDHARYAYSPSIVQYTDARQRHRAMLSIMHTHQFQASVPPPYVNMLLLGLSRRFS